MCGCVNVNTTDATTGATALFVPGTVHYALHFFRQICAGFLDLVVGALTVFSSTEFLSSSRYFQDFLLTNGFNQAGAGALSGAVTGAIAVSASLALGAASASYSAGALTAAQLEQHFLLHLLQKHLEEK